MLLSCSDVSSVVADLTPQPTTRSGILSKVSTACTIGTASQRLLFTPTDSGFVVSLQCFDQTYTPQGQAMAMAEVWQNGFATSEFCTAPYDSIEANAACDSLVAYATLSTTLGSIIQFVDTYTLSAIRGSAPSSPQGGTSSALFNDTANSPQAASSANEGHRALRLSRKVTPLKKATKETAYNTYIMLRKASAQSYTLNEYYMPALIFKDGSNLTDVSIGSNWNDKWILAREERMGLPLVMMREKKSGVALSLTDYNLSPTTDFSDWGNNHLSSDAFKYASLGYNLQGNAPALTYCFPGSEGEHTYSNGASVIGWSRRSTPLGRTHKQSYTVDILATQSASFEEAQRDHWQSAFDLYSPAELKVDSKKVMEVSLETLDHYWLKSGMAPGFPFSVYCKDGKVNETSFDMGFVGMQTACAYYLYRDGLDNGNETYRKKGEQILDFWANHSANDKGMPRIWYDIEPWNSFRNYNDLRNMQGGMEPMLLAWSCAEAAHPGSHANWLKFCKNAADWIVSQQTSDGSFPKAFDNNGAVVDNGTYLTSNIVRYLTMMYGVTANKKYRTAVTKAADWCIKNITTGTKYVGSVIDNPYVKDRESGQKMIEAMLAAYDLTGNQKYLDAAQKAAYYTVSYMYAWNLPWETNTTLAMPWPKHKSTVGITIIATGHSGADCGFSYNSFEYLRLYNLTGDEYLLRIARLLEKNTKQTMNYDGSLGYYKRGLQREAIRCVTHRGDGVALWLPWCTASALDPLFRMQDAYGNYGIDNLLPQSATRASGNAPLLDDTRYVQKLGMVRLPDGKTY